MRELQTANISNIFIAFSVLKFLRSNEVRELQPPNIPFISLTLPVLKFLRSNEVRELQPANIWYISVTLSVLIYSKPLIEYRALKPILQSGLENKNDKSSSQATSIPSPGFSIIILVMLPLLPSFTTAWSAAFSVVPNGSGEMVTTVSFMVALTRVPRWELQPAVAVLDSI